MRILLVVTFGFCLFIAGYLVADHRGKEGETNAATTWQIRHEPGREALAEFIESLPTDCQIDMEAGSAFWMVAYNCP